jgi:hypothetical protein
MPPILKISKRKYSKIKEHFQGEKKKNAKKSDKMHFFAIYLKKYAIHAPFRPHFFKVKHLKFNTPCHDVCHIIRIRCHLFAVFLA